MKSFILSVQLPWLYSTCPWTNISPELELLAARHSVPHTGAAERVHVLHDDKRRLLQSDDGQVVLLLLGRRVQLEARPHVVPHGEGASLPLADLYVREEAGGEVCVTYRLKQEALPASD